MRADLVCADVVEQPVTRWLCGMRRGDAAATEGLWAVYFRRLRGLARRLLRGRVVRTIDGEDVAASVFRSFYDRARAGEFSRLRGRGDLWALLAALTSNKCVDRMRREGRVKRGGRAAAMGLSRVGDVVGGAEGPLGLAELADLRERFFSALDGCADPALRRIVQWKLEGETTGEVARRLGCVRRTVERKIRLIQEVWSEIV
jgi:DNA-directed RNA polymerase specialized sigma24 family protein